MQQAPTSTTKAASNALQNPFGKKQSRTTSAQIQPGGCIGQPLSTSTFHHLMNSCTGKNLHHHYRLVILLSSQNTLAILLTRKPISRNKSRRPNSTIGRPAATSVSLTRPNQCTYGTQESMFGNRARFSTAKTLIENQEPRCC